MEKNKTPNHYKLKIGKIECDTNDVIDSLERTIPQGVCSRQQWWLIANSLKYIFRFGKKGDILQDVRKAIHYLEILEENIQNNLPINNKGE